jgi:hypothetical protein
VDRLTDGATAPIRNRTAFDTHPTQEDTMLGSLLTLLVVGILGLIALSVVLAIVGAVLSITFGIVGFLLFKVAPILFVGWVVLKLVDRSRGRRQISAADQRWLDQ